MFDRSWRISFDNLMFSARKFDLKVFGRFFALRFYVYGVKEAPCISNFLWIFSRPFQTFILIPKTIAQSQISIKFFQKILNEYIYTEFKLPFIIQKMWVLELKLLKTVYNSNVFLFVWLIWWEKLACPRMHLPAFHIMRTNEAFAW